MLEAPVGIVEAAAGYGKSFLAAEFSRALAVTTAWVSLGTADNEAAILASSTRRSLKAARLSDLHAAMGEQEPTIWFDRLLEALASTDDPVLLVFDDAHHLQGPGAAGQLTRLAECLPAPHRLLVAARHLPPHLGSLRTVRGATSVGTEELAFTREETAELATMLLGRGLDGYRVQVLWEESAGWATALVLACAAMSSPDHLSGHTGSPPAGTDAIGPLLETILARLGATDRDWAVQLAHLPQLSPAIADAVAGDPALFARIIDVGIPVARQADGWWEMPGPVTAYLAAQQPLRASAAAPAAAAYCTDGHVRQAVQALLAADLTEEAAAVVGGIGPEQAEELGVAQLRSFLDALPERAIDGHPRGLLNLCRVAETGHRPDLRGEALDRAIRAIGMAQPPNQQLLLEAQAERARDLMWDERTRSEARAAAAAVIERAGGDDTVAKARALDVLGRLHSWWSDCGPQPEAEPMLEESARLAMRVGLNTWAARALVALSMGFYHALGRNQLALATLDRALALLPARAPFRVVIQSHRSSVLTEEGRFAEAESVSEEMREAGRALGEEWVHAYASWCEAETASYRNDGPRTVRAMLDVEQHRDGWFEQTAGIEFLSQGADLLDRVGEHDLATKYLGRARQRMEGFERTVRVFEASVAGRSGDPVQAERIVAEALARPDLEPQERWPLMLLRADAARRRGDAAAGALAAEAFELCRDLGIPDSPLRRERVAAEALLPLASAAGSEAAKGLIAGAARVSLTTLGEFEVRRGGQIVTLPAGRPARAVRAVAAMGGRMQASALCEILWPEAELEAGRNRLRNLLSRIRVAAGDLLVRDGDAIRLTPGAEVDSVLFAAQAEEALSTRSTAHAVAVARAAVGRYRGDLLPEDIYETWANHPRERLRLAYLRLLDLLAAHAEASGEVDEAVRILRRAIDTERYEEHRYVRVATLLAEQGRVASARAALRSARTALAELEVQPTTDLRLLEERLAAGRDTGPA